MKTNQFRSIIKESIRELIAEGVFKDIVKECVSEMITEGGFLSNDSQIDEAALKKGLIKNNQLEKMAMEFGRVSARGKDSSTVKIYEDIYADTARTTLQKQIINDPQGVSSATKNLLINDGADPEQIKSDSAQLSTFSASNRWAQVAFAKKPQ
jgi:hypothetical protein